MRLFAAAVAAVVLFLSLPAAAQTETVVITARRIALYPDRRLLISEGGVSARFDDLQITATSAAYDLRSNRMTFAGDVTVTKGTAATQGTGYVYAFAGNSGVFVRDAVVPQFTLSEALATSQQVRLVPGTSITFSNADVRAGTDFVPAGSYRYAIPAPTAKDFGYSPVPSAALEWPLLVSHGSNGYTFARLRYDKYNGGPGAGMEEHYAASDRGYVALAQTLDVDRGRYDLLAFQRFNQTLSQSLTASALPGQQSARYAITSSSRRGFASLSFAQYNGSRSDDLLLTGLDRPVARLGTSRLQIDFGHDVHPADWPVAQDFRVTPALHFDTATAHVGRSTVSGSFDVGESWYSYGRATLATAAGVWSSVPVNRRLQFNGGLRFTHEAPPLPATTRTYTAGMTWRPSSAFNLVSSLEYTHDFGQAFGVGRPQYSASFDVTFRRKNGTGLEIGSILPFGGVGDMYRQAAFNVRFLK